jgi:uncharacterized RDD family membrane protein YckC
MDSPELEYVGFWLRFWAFIIDSVLSMIILWPILRAYGGADYWPDLYAYTGTGVRGLLLQLVLPALAVIIFWIARQATPGKMAIGATIVDAETGARPTTAQFIGRYLAYYVSMIPCFLGFAWIGIDARKQGWHDKLASTVVVRPRRGASSVQFKARAN